MKVMALPHGGQKNIHGPVVCVPSDLKKVTSLPMKPGEDFVLRVKLKRKLNYKGYSEYQFVDPKHICEALKFLKLNNKWYEERGATVHGYTNRVFPYVSNENSYLVVSYYDDYDYYDYEDTEYYQ